MVSYIAKNTLHRNMFYLDFELCVNLEVRQKY